VIEGWKKREDKGISKGGWRIVYIVHTLLIAQQARKGMDGFF